MRKTFACGHTGKGKFCHRCAQAEQAREHKHKEKQYLVDKAQAVGLPVDHLPKEIQIKAIKIADQLLSGTPYTSYKGSKRLVKRTVVSIPVGRTYRMLCRDEDGKIVPVEVLSHEAYNIRVRYAMTSGI